MLALVTLSFTHAALLFYASLLHLDDEIRYIWKPKFTAATVLYLLSKYPPFFNLVLVVVAGFVTRNDNAANQSICKKKLKIISIHSESIILIAYYPILVIVENVTTVLSDVLAFLAVIRQVWGLWKEKRRLGLHTGKDFVTLLLQQVSRIKCPFMLLPLRLSVILICEFTLDLRRRNTTRSLPNQSALEFPNLNPSSQDNPEARSIQSVLGHLQESIIADMGERNDPMSMGIDAPGQGEPDLETA
ncbi:hypothetical protein Clacol_004891 [Clathrus columnatus]|uniref:DUF6533 domain-containing protein n=1 Tax=Clathrus columnatus TaxID=1419009 RepID=A0AAV5A7R7_9AGAM|nr:hypothetical protein Clacol_004891 [Clathrus columnatus]